MKNYLDLVANVISTGAKKLNRTGVVTRSLCGQSLRFDDIDQQFPLATTRNVPFRMIFEETMFFLRGETQTKILEEKGVGIWKGNTSREFLDQRKLFSLDEGDMGKGYGHQIRNFGSSGYDQLTSLISGLRNDPWDRRHVISHWCPFELKDAALPPCHIMHMYSVCSENYLDSSFVMRSSDIFHGLPFNIASYALINILISNCCKLIPRSLVYFGHDVHIYETHLDVAKQQVERTPRNLPQLELLKNLYKESVEDTVEELLSLKFEDVKLKNYSPHTALKAAMVV